MNNDDIQAQIDAWRAEYEVVYPVTFAGFENLGKGTLGRCSSAYGRSTITLAEFWRYGRNDFLLRSVLWHEMAHAIAYLEDMRGNSHDDRWREIRSWKKAYVAGDFLAKLFYSPKTW